MFTPVLPMPTSKSVGGCHLREPASESVEVDLALTEALCPAVLTVSQVLCVTFDYQLGWVRASGLSEANI